MATTQTGRGISWQPLCDLLWSVVWIGQLWGQSGIYPVGVDVLAGVLGGVASLAAAIYWIVAFAEIARTPAWQFEAADSNKVFWIFIVLSLPVVGAVAWLLFRRERVLRAEDWDDPEAPADWYLDEEAGALRWWDGYGWTDRYRTWSGTRPAH